jgi:uncharacterized membrane protein YoaK (UPF0700 family)
MLYTYIVRSEGVDLLKRMALPILGFVIALFINELYLDKSEKAYWVIVAVLIFSLLNTLFSKD